MFRVNQSRIRRIGGIVEFSGSGFASGILRGGDDFKIVIFQFFVDFLPAWQVKFASSPRSPGQQQYFFATKI